MNDGDSETETVEVRDPDGWCIKVFRGKCNVTYLNTYQRNRNTFSTETTLSDKICEDGPRQKDFLCIVRQ